MRIYFDTEFSGLQQDTQLISIGMIREDGQTLYAEIEGLNVEKMNDWVKENVIAKMKHDTKEWDEGIADIQIYGSKEDVRDAITKFTSDLDEVQFVADVGHFDFVLLTDLYGNAFCFPDNFSPTCYDINQDIAKREKISQREAFDISRESYIIENGRSVDTTMKHNALTDAIGCKEIYEILNEKEIVRENEKVDPLSALVLGAKAELEQKVSTRPMDEVDKMTPKEMLDTLSEILF